MLCLIGRAAKQEAGANPGFLFFSFILRNSTAQAETFCRNIFLQFGKSVFRAFEEVFLRFQTHTNQAQTYHNKGNAI
jgi:hypothetical protein